MLRCLATLGVDRAIDTLLQLAQTVPVDQLHEAVFQLLGPDGEALSSQLPSILTDRLTDEELVSTMRSLYWLRWLVDPPSWIRDDPRLARALDAARPATRQPNRPGLPPTPEESLAANTLRRWSINGGDLQAGREALLQMANENTLMPNRGALHILATQGDPSAPLAVEIALQHPANEVRIAGRRAVHVLHGPEAISAARHWIVLEDESELPYYATEVIGNTGGPEDLPRLRQLATLWTTKGAMYAMCTAAEALAKLHDSESIPWFRDRFESTEYSSLRKRCARAICDVDPDFPADLAIECLWDCEPETREVGARSISRVSRRELTRLRELATSKLEESDTKAAASARLEQLSAAP